MVRSVVDAMIECSCGQIFRSAEDLVAGWRDRGKVMSIKYAPKNGTLLICDFDGIVPEMIKRRPVVVLSSVSPGLAIVVPLSTTWPSPVMPWHYNLHLADPLPKPYDNPVCWAKGDMVATVSFERLILPFKGKDRYGKRIYQINQLPESDLVAVRAAVWRAFSGVD
ncbi:type II toxin-antitoxin system PemK/MazF family toxin [Solidesulfovibrio sp.]